MSKKKVESIRHRDKRKNIPTEELRDFMADDEHAPKSMLYPRDPSLDPQLVWKGKDEQDRARDRGDRASSLEPSRPRRRSPAVPRLGYWRACPYGESFRLWSPASYRSSL